MAKKNKYSKVKPKVSPLTYVIVGLVFVALVVIIALSINTPKEKFNNRFGLEDNNYQLISVNKLENKIDKGEEVLVIVGLAKNTTTPVTLLHELQVVYDESNSRYSDDDRKNLPSVVYYVEITDEEQIADFIEKYEITVTSQDPFMLAFNNVELIAEFNGTKDHGAISQDPTRANLIRNLKEFFAKLAE